MTERELQTALERLAPREPAQTHEDFLRAVWSAEGETKRMKKQLRLVPILVAIIVLLLATTAWAMVNRSSVTDYDKSERLASHVIAINQDYEDERIKLSFNDAVFDGQQLSLVMDAENKKPEEPVFVQVGIYATDENGYTLETDVEGCGGLNFFSGSLFPALTPQIDDGQPWSVDVALLDETLPTGDVHWKFTVRVLTPNWPLEVGDDVFDGTEDYDAIMQRYKDAYAQKKIRALDGADLVEYCSVLPRPVTVDEYTWTYMRWWEQLVACGAFDLYTTVDCEFTASAPREDTALNIAPDTVYDLGDFTAYFQKLDKTFQTVSFTLRCDFKDADLTETKQEELSEVLTHVKSWHLYLDDALMESTTYMSSGLEEDGDGVRYLSLGAGVSIPEEMSPDTLTIVPLDVQGQELSAEKIQVDLTGS